MCSSTCWNLTTPKRLAGYLARDTWAAKDDELKRNIEAANELVARGATAVHALVSHGVFSEGSMERIDRSPIVSILMTDSVETQPVKLSDKIEVVSVAPLFGEAVRRIHDRESISDLFAT